MQIFLYPTLMFCMLNFFSSDSTPERSPAVPTQKCNASFVMPDDTESRVSPNTIYQSKDGGLTWQDISHSLPGTEKPKDFFASESELYLRIENEMYRSKANLKTPVWEKENVLDPRFTSIAFNYSGVMAYNYKGEISQKTSAGIWLPIHISFKKESVNTIFETLNGTIFLACDNGVYKSADKGKSWKHTFNEGGVMQLVESEGVILGTGSKGIMRSTDNGEHWEWVISEGGVGIAVERINGGFAAIAFNSGIQARRIQISMDGGETWEAIDAGLRPALSISSIKQIGKYLICGHPDGIFRSSDMGKTWNLVHLNFDDTFNIFDKKVYKIYVSGSVLYAMENNMGC
jgi:photosystem II stability/assembly factor-like uncharacterized protein